MRKLINFTTGLLIGILIALLLFAASGCSTLREHKVYGLGDNAIVILGDEKEIIDKCGCEGCVKKVWMGDRYLYFLYGLTPYDWTDTYAHIVNGHEFMHLLKMLYEEE